MRAYPKWIWLVLLALALGIAVIAWRLGENLSIDLRIVLSALPLLLWSLALLFWTGGTRGSVRSASLDEEEPGDTPASANRHQLETVLRRHRLSGRSGRYRVPLFLVLGPSGTGKSELLERSGIALDLPIEDGYARWWVGPDAIFVEVTTGLANMEILASALERFRPAAPVNGIVLAVSPADLALADTLERREIGEAVAAAIATIERRTRSRPPVTVILTKADLAPGFAESMEGLTAQERDQVWGFALPLPVEGKDGKGDDPLQLVRTGIRQLVEATRMRLIDVLSRIDDPLHSGRLVHFGAQIAALDATIDTILRPLLPNAGRGRAGAFLRGVYLTSARQEALTIDALLPELSTRFAMPRSGMLPPDLDGSERTESFFIASTMRRAVLGEAGLIGRVKPPMYRRTAFAAAVLVAVLGGCLLSALYLRDSSLRAEAGIDAALSPGAGFVPETLRVADAEPETIASIAADVDRLSRFDPRPAIDPLWRPFVDADRLETVARDAYDDALSNSLRPNLIARIEGDLVDLDAPPEALARWLAAADPSAGDHAGALSDWIEDVAARSGNPSAGQALEAQASRALADLSEGNGPRPRYLDTARRIIDYEESLR